MAQMTGSRNRAGSGDRSGAPAPTLLRQGYPRAWCVGLHPDGSGRAPVRETPQPGSRSGAG